MQLARKHTWVTDVEKTCVAQMKLSNKGKVSLQIGHNVVPNVRRRNKGQGKDAYAAANADEVRRKIELATQRTWSDSMPGLQVRKGDTRRACTRASYKGSFQWGDGMAMANTEPGESIKRAEGSLGDTTWQKCANNLQMKHTEPRDINAADRRDPRGSVLANVRHTDPGKCRSSQAIGRGKKDPQAMVSLVLTAVSKVKSGTVIHTDSRSDRDPMDGINFKISLPIIGHPAFPSALLAATGLFCPATATSQDINVHHCQDHQSLTSLAEPVCCQFHGK
ncbi:hypothetical protein IWX50DRAFT_621079 [Phyllosticta citricarpa]